MIALRSRLLGILSLLALAGCSADGGPVGTGITSSAITGNVVAVETGAAAEGHGARLDVTVRVTLDEVPGIEDTTDENGNFELEGDFSGPLTLRFATAAVEATQAIDIPTGSTTVLEDITVRPQRIETASVRQLGFLGRIDVADCTDGTLLVNDRRVQPRQFLVRIVSETLIEHHFGEQLDCTDLVPTTFVEVQGIVRGDRTIEALAITVSPPPPPPQPPAVRRVRFSGNVTLIDCRGGVLLLGSPAGRSRLHLRPSTQYLREDAAMNRVPSTCSAIAIGDRVQGSGLLRIAAPGAIEADLVISRPPLRPASER